MCCTTDMQSLKRRRAIGMLLYIYIYININSCDVLGDFCHNLLSDAVFLLLHRSIASAGK